MKAISHLTGKLRRRPPRALAPAFQGFLPKVLNLGSRWQWPADLPQALTHLESPIPNLEVPQKVLEKRNLPARIGFQKIWRLWSWTVRLWEPGRGSAAERLRLQVLAHGRISIRQATQPLCCGWLRETKQASITSR